MKIIVHLVNKAYNKKIDASGLAVFRVLYSVVLLCDVIQLFYFRHLIFDEIPYIQPSEISLGIPLIVWMLSLILLSAGLFTREVSIINYIFSLVFIATIDTYEYHMYYIYMVVNFILIFINPSKVGSFDALRLKLKYSNTRHTFNPPRETSVLNYIVPLLVGIAFVYFDSVFYKFSSELWLKGLGVWLPSSVPQITHINLSWILNQKWLMMVLSYLTLIFESIFIFTFFRKKWRVPLLIIGIGLHLGIMIFYPIPRFGLGVIGLYFLMVPVCFWRRTKKTLSFNQPYLTFYYDEECPLCNRTKLILGHLDFFNAIEFKGVQTFGFDDERLKNISKDELLNNIYSITRSNKILYGIDTYKRAFKYIPLLFPLGWMLSLPGIYHLGKFAYKKIAENRYVERCTEENCGFSPPSFPQNNDEMKLTKKIKLKDLKVRLISLGLVLLCILQLNVTYNSTFIKTLKERVGFEGSKIENIIQRGSYTMWALSKRLFGISNHPVFINRHFENYNHTIAVVYDRNGHRVWLPITDKSGMLGSWQVGPIWAKWGFRINSANVDSIELADGIRDFTAFWAVKNDIDLDSAEFEIKVKRNATPSGWEKDFLDNQLDNPWLNGGYVEWEKGIFKSYIKDIESL